MPVEKDITLNVKNYNSMLVRKKYYLAKVVAKQEYLCVIVATVELQVRP